VINREGVYVAYANGIVRDSKTGLEWIAGPDEETTFDEAKAWIRSQAIDGGGWRMPTEAELKTLYKTGAGIRNMTPLLKTTGWLVWRVGKANDSTGEVFNFDARAAGWYYSDTVDKRVFAVRSRSDG